MRCCFSRTCLAFIIHTSDTPWDMAVRKCSSVNIKCNEFNITCDECGVLCDGGKLCFLSQHYNARLLVKRLESLGIDETYAVAFLCYMDLSSPNTNCAKYKCNQTMQGVPDVCMVIVSGNNAIFASIECKCNVTRRPRLASALLISKIRAKVDRLRQRPNFIVLLLNRELYEK